MTQDLHLNECLREWKIYFDAEEVMVGRDVNDVRVELGRFLHHLYPYRHTPHFQSNVVVTSVLYGYDQPCYDYVQVIVCTP